MSPTTVRSRRKRPPSPAVSAPVRKHAIVRPAMRLRDRSNAHGNRTWTGPVDVQRQPVTSRSHTGLTVTFSRPADRPLQPGGRFILEHVRPVLRATMGRRNLHPARHPGRAGAWSGSALTRPSWAAALAQRSSLGRDSLANLAWHHQCDGKEHGATPLYNGDQTDEIPIEKRHCKLLKLAAERVATGPREWLAHQFND